MWSVIRGGTRQLIFLVGVISNKSGKFKYLSLQGDHPPPSSLQFPSVVRHPDLPIRKTLRRVLDLLTVIILKGLSDSVFFQSNTFTACKVEDEKDVTNSLMAFTVLKIIHPFQGEKQIRT